MAITSFNYFLNLFYLLFLKDLVKNFLIPLTLLNNNNNKWNMTYKWTND